MPKFKCENIECIKHTEIEDIRKVRFTWNPKTMRLESEHDICPECGSYRNVVKEEGGFTNMWFKSEDSRNYNNKTVKKYDYDYKPSDDKAIAPLTKGV